MKIGQLRCVLAEACEQAGSQYQWATRSKLSPAYVSDVLRGKRDPGEGLLKALGLRKVVSYEKINP